MGRGVTRVAADVLAQVDAQGRRLATARRRADTELDNARELALSLLEAHAIPEKQLAERLGVNRSTIREWTGKQ